MFYGPPLEKHIFNTIERQIIFGTLSGKGGLGGGYFITSIVIYSSAY